MSPTHDMIIDNSTGANVRADLNNALAALVSNSSSSSEPSTKYAYQTWVDTTANIIKIRNSSNNAWINLFTTAGGVDVDAASTFSEDVTFTGASANIIFDKSADDLIFNDTAKAVFGTGGDLQVYHDGTNSVIDSNTGDLLIRNLGTTGDIYLDAKSGERGIKVIQDGAVELYHDNSKKFETKSDGVLVTGELQATTLDINGNGHIDGTLQLTNDLFLGDNDKINIGNSNDLQIYHDSNHSYLANSTGALYFRSGTGINFQTAGGAETYFYTEENGAVFLSYDNSMKFQTTSGGCALTGSLQMSNTGKIQSGSSGHSFTIQGGATLGGGSIRFAGGSADGDLRFSTGSNSSFTEKMRISTSSVGQLFVGCTAEPGGGSSGIMLQGNGFQAIGYSGLVVPMYWNLIIQTIMLVK